MYNGSLFSTKFVPLQLKLRKIQSKQIYLITFNYMFHSEIMSPKYMLLREVTISTGLPAVHIPYIQG